MQDKMTASVVCTDLEPETISAITAALQDAGFDHVKVLKKIAPLRQQGEGNSVQFHLPDDLSGSNFILLDEFVGGRSAFELHSLLKPAVESANIAYGILLLSPPDTTIFAAWVAGFDLCIRKEELDMEEFGGFCRRILAGLKAEDAPADAADAASNLESPPAG